MVTPAWATLDDWLEILAADPLATPLVDFGPGVKYRVGVSTLNWYLMDLLGLRVNWYTEGWLSRDEVWLLINPLRYRLLGHQPKRPYPLDVKDYLKQHRPQVLYCTLAEHPYFAIAPVYAQHEHDDLEIERLAAQAPWGRVAIANQEDLIVGMVWQMMANAGNLPPITNLFTTMFSPGDSLC
jgi:hypothetical protein